VKARVLRRRRTRIIDRIGSDRVQLCGVCPGQRATNSPRSTTNSRFSFTRPMPRILFVSGFHPATRARDLAFEFERYSYSPFLCVFLQAESRTRFGPLIRCDVPAPRNPSAHSNPYVSSVFFPLLLPLQCHECLLRRAFARRLRTYTRMHASFPFDFERRRLPRHSISRRIRTKAQHPSTVAVTHSSSFAAPATLKTPIMTCMFHSTFFPSFSPPISLFSSPGTDACSRVRA
jgi:hypothetical protein